MNTCERENREDEIREESRADAIEWIRQACCLRDIMEALKEWESYPANDCLDGDAIGDIIDESGVVESLGLCLPSDLPKYVDEVVWRDTMVLFDPRRGEVLDYEGGFNVFAIDMDKVAAIAMRRAATLEEIAEAIGYVDEVFPFNDYLQALSRVGAFDVTDTTAQIYCAKIARDGSFDIVFGKDDGGSEVRNLKHDDAPQCVLDAERAESKVG